MRGKAGAGMQDSARGMARDVPRSRRRRGPPRAAILALAALAANCQASPSGSAAADDAADFRRQGEYAGTFGTPPAGLGAQVIARGNGSFTAVFLSGGLPGAGWDSQGRAEAEGDMRGDTVFFPAPAAGGYAARIAPDGSFLAGTTPQGDSFSLAKIMRESPTLGAPAPERALVLFDGKDLSAFVAGTAALDSGLLLPQGSAGSGAVTMRSFGDFSLHLEFLVPFMPDHTGQARGNSGVYLQGRYELQILDSFGLDIFRTDAAASQECGAFYQLAAPGLNMSFPPLSWQTYDVDFVRARFDSAGRNQVRPAVVTVRLNGVAIHSGRELAANTLLGDPVGPAAGPLRFQAHGDPVKFRNIWIVENPAASVRPAPPGRAAGSRGDLGGAALPADRVRADGKKTEAWSAGSPWFPGSAAGASAKWR